MANPSDTPLALKTNSLGLVECVVMSAAFMGPASVIFFSTPFNAGFSGAAFPLSFGIAMIATLLIANTVAQYARKIASAGSFFSYSVAGLGPVAGFVAGWMIVFAYAMFEPGAYGLFGNYISGVFATVGVNVSWWWFAVAAGALVITLSLLGILESLKAGLLFLIFEALAILTIVVVIFFRQAEPNGLTLHPFDPAFSPTGWDGVFLGAIWGMFGFIGFEGSTTLGEEARMAKKKIPIAMIGTVLLVGAFYIVSTYAQSSAWGTSPEQVAALTESGEPWIVLAAQYLGTPGKILVYFAGFTGILGVWIAIHNSVTRVIYGMARSGVLPRFLAWTHPRFRTPWAAIALEECIAITLVIWIGIQSGPLSIYGYLGVLGTIGVMVVYGLLGIGLPRLYWTRYRAEFNPLLHVVLPLMSLIFIGIMLWENATSTSTFPYNTFPYVSAAYLLVGLLVALYYKFRSPALLDALAGEFSVDVTERDEDSVLVSAPVWATTVLGTDSRAAGENGTPR